MKNSNETKKHLIILSAGDQEFVWSDNNFDTKTSAIDGDYTFTDEEVTAELKAAKDYAQTKYYFGEWAVNADNVYSEEQSFEDESEIIS